MVQQLKLVHRLHSWLNVCICSINHLMAKMTGHHGIRRADDIRSEQVCPSWNSQDVVGCGWCHNTKAKHLLPCTPSRVYATGRLILSSGLTSAAQVRDVGGCSNSASFHLAKQINTFLVVLLSYRMLFLTTYLYFWNAELTVIRSWDAGIIFPSKILILSMSSLGNAWQLQDDANWYVCTFSSILLY